jgi:hypothetical protein
MKLKATGEGQRSDQELWSSIRMNWLDKICPYYEAIDDILQRDKSFTPFYVSETGGEAHYEARSRGSTWQQGEQIVEGSEMEGVRQEDSQHQRNQESLIDESDTEVEVVFNTSTPTEHPPAGGSKNPRKRGASSGTGQKGLKREKFNAEEEILRSIQCERLAFEKERFQYEIQRDEVQHQLAEKREENRHEEALIRMRLLEMRLQNQNS